jgi:cobalt-zinc-cadmium efflux system protein
MGPDRTPVVQGVSDVVDVPIPADSRERESFPLPRCADAGWGSTLVAMGHDHDHHAPPVGVGSGAVRVIAIALALNAVLAVGQVAAGFAFGSIALLADSVHQVVDVVGLAIALLGARLAARGVTTRNTYGWGRADVLGALVSAGLLVGSSVWIAIEAARRLADPPGIEGVPVLVVAVIGLLVNAGSAVALSRVSGSMSARAAVLHLIGDAAGSAAVLVSAIAVIVADATWVDPLVAIAIAVWVAWTGVRLLRASGRVLLDAVPEGLTTAGVTETMRSVAGVVDVHHVHLWEPSPGEPSVSAHVLVDGDMAVHSSQTLLDQVRGALRDEHGIVHATFEVECHPCEDEQHWSATVAGDEGE